MSNTTFLYFLVAVCILFVNKVAANNNSSTPTGLTTTGSITGNSTSTTGSGGLSPCNNIKFIPFLEETHFESNTLFFTVRLPTASASHFNWEIWIPGCSGHLPQPTVYSNGCYDYFTTYKTWNTTSTCKFINTTLSDAVVFRVPIYVTTGEVIKFMGSNITKWSTDLLNINLRFPTAVSVSSTVTITNSTAAGMEAYVSDQSYNGATSTGLVQFQTGVLAPYQVQSVLWLAKPSGMAVINLAQLVLPACPFGGPTCLQYWSFNVVPNITAGTCVLDGEYVMAVTMVDSNTGLLAFSEIHFVLSSSNFCGWSDADVHISSNLNSYSDSTFAVQQSSFTTGSTGYFRAQISSDGSISSVKINNITSNSATLYSPSKFISNPVVKSVSTNNQGATFSIDFDPSVFPVPGMAKQYTITVVLEVKYANNKRALYSFTEPANPAVSSHIQLLPEQEQGQKRQEQDVELKTDNMNPAQSRWDVSESSSATNVYASSLALLSVLFVAFFM